MLEQGLDKLEKKRDFKELPPEDFWGFRIDLGDISREELEESMQKIDEKLDFTFTGFLLPQDNSYCFSRYPRKFEGSLVSKDQCQEAINMLCGELGVKGELEKLSNEPKFRVVLGMEEGYSEHEREKIIEEIEDGKFETVEKLRSRIESLIGDELEDLGLKDKMAELKDVLELKDFLESLYLGKCHSFKEVEEELGDGFDLKRAEIMVVESQGNYEEPAVVIEGDLKDLRKVYALALKFKQARIAVEDLEAGKTWIVETKYCED